MITMSTESNKDIVRRYIEAYSDLTGASSTPLLSDTAQLRLMARSKGLPLPQVLTKLEYLELFHTMSTMLPNGIRHEIRSMIGEGDWVAVETECFADLTDGRTYNNLFYFLIGIRDGQIHTVHEYTDFLHTKEALFDSPGPADQIPVGASAERPLKPLS